MTERIEFDMVLMEDVKAFVKITKSEAASR